MSNYDYQENPQVAYWKEQCKKLSETLRENNSCRLQSEINERNIAFMEEQLDKANHKLAEADKEIQRLIMQIDELKDDMETFNSLPWFEKMFHKFYD